MITTGRAPHRARPFLFPSHCLLASLDLDLFDATAHGFRDFRNMTKWGPEGVSFDETSSPPSVLAPAGTDGFLVGRSAKFADGMAECFVREVKETVDGVWNPNVRFTAMRNISV
jgi:hypothetical protein